MGRIGLIFTVTVIITGEWFCLRGAISRFAHVVRAVAMVGAMFYGLGVMMLLAALSRG